MRAAPIPGKSKQIFRTSPNRKKELALAHSGKASRAASIADEREICWREMRDRHAKLWRKARKALRNLPQGPRAAIARYWQICGCPGDPVYLLSIIHEHKARKVCYWHVMAELRRLRLMGMPRAGTTEDLDVIARCSSKDSFNGSNIAGSQRSDLLASLALKIKASPDRVRRIYFRLSLKRATVLMLPRYFHYIEPADPLNRVLDRFMQGKRLRDADRLLLKKHAREKDPADDRVRRLARALLALMADKNTTYDYPLAQALRRLRSRIPRENQPIADRSPPWSDELH